MGWVGLGEGRVEGVGGFGRGGGEGGGGGWVWARGRGGWRQKNYKKMNQAQTGYQAVHQ